MKLSAALTFAIDRNLLLSIDMAPANFHRQPTAWRQAGPLYLSVFFLITLIGCFGSDGEPSSGLPTNDQLSYSRQPSAPRSFFELTERPASEFDQACEKLREQLQRLADFGNQVRLNQSNAKPPSVLDDSFQTSFIQRNKLTAAYWDEQIRIARWRRDEKTPTELGGDGLTRLFSAVLSPWEKAKKFRIEFQLHQVEDRPNYYDANVLVELFGEVPAETVADAEGRKSVGRSSIGIWQIVWRKPENGGEPKIKKINMLGHEETLTYLPNGQLFSDCTAAVIDADSVAANQLAYSMDQWAKRIPFLDTVGDQGLAIADFDGDGLDDFYVCQGHGLPNLLFHHRDDGTAEEVAAKAGVNFSDATTAALWADLDNDNRQDLVLATEQSLLLLSNRGDGTFLLEQKLRIGARTESLSAADYDRDGDLDLFLAKYRDPDSLDDIFPEPDHLFGATNGSRNVLLRNDEAWRFTDVTVKAGIKSKKTDYTNAAIWADYDSDGDVDLYLANEFQRDRLLTNVKGHFSDSDLPTLFFNSGNSKTVSVADFNRDGKSDFFVGANSSFLTQRMSQYYIDLGGKRLKEANSYRAENLILSKTAPTSFQNYKFRSPIFSSQSSYSSVAGDFNNDGFEDLVVTNGWLSRPEQTQAESLLMKNLFDPEKDLKSSSKARRFQLQHEIADRIRQGAAFDGYQRNRFFLTLGKQRFANFSNGSGFNYLEDSRAIASTDWDNDGDLDLITINRTAPRLRILTNNFGDSHQFLKLRLRGTQSNRDAVGARIDLYLRGLATPLTRTVMAGTGRKSQSTKEIHFGLGVGVGIEKMVVSWPSGLTQSFANVDQNRIYEIVEGETELNPLPVAAKKIDLTSTPLKAKNGLPPTRRRRFFPTARLPIVQHRLKSKSSQTRWYEIENIKNRVLLVLLCPIDEQYSSWLKRWNEYRSDIATYDADLLLCFVGLENDASDLDQFQKLIDDIEFPFRWGVVGTSGNRKLAHAFGNWFYNYRLPDKPFALLLDGQGQIHFGYDFDQIDWRTISEDLQSLTAIEKTSAANWNAGQIGVSESTRWADVVRIPRFDLMMARYEEAGYEKEVDFLEDFQRLYQSYTRVEQALDFASNGDLHAANKAINHAIELAPNSRDAKIQRARVLNQYARNLDSQTRIRMQRIATDSLDEVITESPGDAEAVKLRVQIFQEQGDLDNAIDLLNQYLKIASTDWAAHAALGRCYLDNNNLDEAEQHLSQAFENQPTLADVAGDLGKIFLNKKQFDVAAKYLKSGLALQPSASDIRIHLANAEFWLKNIATSRQLLQQAVASSSDLDSATAARGRLLLAWLMATASDSRTRDGKAALVLASAAALENVDELTVMEVKAASYAALGNFEKAAELQTTVETAVFSGRTLRKYTETQIQAMRRRLQQYRQKQIYSTTDPAESPFDESGN